MIVNVDFSMFELAFEAAGKGHQFSAEAQQAIYNELNKQPDYELDVDRVCNTYMEFKTPTEAVEYYSLKDYDDVKSKTDVLELTDGSVVVKQIQSTQV